MNPAHLKAWADWQPGPHRERDVSAVLPRERALAVVLVAWAVVA